MRYMVGYQITEQDEWVRAIISMREHVNEVYFPWHGFASGRGNPACKDPLPAWAVYERTQKDLDRLHEAGIPLTLLLNGNCYGAESLSKAFFLRIQQTLEYLMDRYEIRAVTTSSPLIGRFICGNCPQLEVRASVNMGIGTPQGMESVLDDFDGFYMQRECNRNWHAIETLRRYCDQNRKKLYLLANSGCLVHCAAHTFHDNLVAHESEIAVYDNMLAFKGVCWESIQKPGRDFRVLRDTTFVRPEDIPLYEQWFDGIKLATRSNMNPARVLRSYAAKAYSGPLTALMEPDYTRALYPRVLENRRIDPDFARHVLKCDKRCDTCSYCEDTYNKALITLSDTE